MLLHRLAPLVEGLVGRVLDRLRGTRVARGDRSARRPAARCVEVDVPALERRRTSARLLEAFERLAPLCGCSARALAGPRAVCHQLVELRADALAAACSKRVSIFASVCCITCWSRASAQQPADAGYAVGLAPIVALGQRGPDEAQQRAQALEAAARVVDGRRECRCGSQAASRRSRVARARCGWHPWQSARPA